MTRKRRGSRAGAKTGAARRGRFTPEQLRELGVEIDDQPAGPPLELSDDQLRLAGADAPTVRACRPTLEADGLKRNDTEKRYERHLGQLLALGRIAGFVFEPMRLRLGPTWQTSYTPDFGVLQLDGVLELVDVKGASTSKQALWRGPDGVGAWVEEDAHVKVKQAAGLYPFRFVFTWERGQGRGWKRKVFPPERATT